MLKYAMDLATDEDTPTKIKVTDESGEPAVLVVDGFDNLDNGTVMVYAYREDNGEDYTFVVDEDEEIEVV